MQTTNLTTKENELQIIHGSYGIGYKSEPREAALTSVKYIYSDLTDIRKYYIRLGFHLEEFRRCNYCVDFGYSCMYEFCEKNLGMDKSAVSRCINVYLAFNAANENKYVSGTVSHGCAMELSDSFKDYSYTQLCEMLPLSPEDRKKVKPDMTVKQIRELKKSLKQKPVATTQPENTTVASTQPKIFDYGEYLQKKGIAERNYIKSLTSVQDNVMLHVFDDRGCKVIDHVWCHILQMPNAKNSYKLVVRTYDSFKSASRIPKSSDQQPDQKKE